jgi:hypothetical protein
MTRFTWLQFRTQSLVAIVGVATIAVALAITGPQLAQLYHTSVATCRVNGDCPAVTNAFLLNDRALQIGLKILVVVVPGLLGVFWGAPLVARELETGTFRLAWTQSVSRSRWLAFKLGLLGLASMAVGGLLSLMATWWSSPLDHVQMNPFAMFDERGLVPVGYAAFALALGVTTGVLIHRTLPAMASTLVIFTATRLAIRSWVRPNLIAPVRITVPDNVISYDGNNGPPTHAPPQAWTVSEQIINGHGHVIGQNGIIGNGNMNIRFGTAGIHIPGVGNCPGIRLHHHAVGTPPSNAALNALVQRCVDQLGIRDVVAYQPASRYWPLQWSELAIYLVLALILAGVSFWWLRRRLS